ncbi:MAG: ArsR/SmtB family transcription factor [Crocinitomicaceae bacterium]
MGTTKKYFYQEEQLRFSDLCKALGHPARISIIQMLSKGRTLNCSDFQSEIQLSLPTISRHCKILFQSGVIGYEVLGNNCFYRLDNRVLDQIIEFFDSINTDSPSLTGQVYYPKNTFITN